MGARIDDVDSGAQHGDGRGVVIEGSLMRRRIDPARQAGEDHHACRSELPCQMRRRVHAVRGRSARSDHRQHRLLQQRQIAAIEQRERRIDDFSQERRIFRIGDRDACCTHRLQLLADFRQT